MKAKQAVSPGKRNNGIKRKSWIQEWKASSTTNVSVKMIGRWFLSHFGLSRYVISTEEHFLSLPWWENSHRWCAAVGKAVQEVEFCCGYSLSVAQTPSSTAGAGCSRRPPSSLPNTQAHSSYTLSSLHWWNLSGYTSLGALQPKNISSPNKPSTTQTGHGQALWSLWEENVIKGK